MMYAEHCGTAVYQVSIAILEYCTAPLTRLMSHVDLEVYYQTIARILHSDMVKEQRLKA
jgi:hypothetical protein